MVLCEDPDRREEVGVGILDVATDGKAGTKVQDIGENDGYDAEGDGDGEDPPRIHFGVVDHAASTWARSTPGVRGRDGVGGLEILRRVGSNDGVAGRDLGVGLWLR